MKRLVVTVLSGIAFLVMQGQNLVPNNNFEDTLRCAGDTSMLYPSQWYSPTLGTPDYYYEPMTPHNSCSTSHYNNFEAWNYSNPYGFQLPHSDVAYAGARFYDEYLAIRLTDSLKAGKKYCVEAYVSLANTSRSGLDLIQFCFSKNQIVNYDSVNVITHYMLDSASADAESTPGVLLLDTANWMYVSDTFIAQGGERYLSIGNFDFDTSRTQYQVVDSSSFGMTYYYFDDIAVNYCDIPEDTNPHQVPPDISLSPNPSSGEFVLTGYFTEQSDIEIFDMLGQKVYEMEISQGSQTISLNLKLAEAVYSYRIKNSESVLKSGKIIIAK